MTLVNQLRSYKIMSFAAFDFIVSYISMYLIGKYFKLDTTKMMLAVVPLSLIIHTMIGLETPLTRSVFSPKSTRDFIILAMVMVNDYFLYKR